MKVIPIPHPVERSVRIYSRCVRLYPKNFRQTFQQELVQVFQAKSQSLYQRQRMRGLISFWLHTFIDTLRTIVIEHLEEVFDMKRNTPKLIAGAFAALGALLAILMMVANWSTLPYPFPSKSGILARLWAFVPVDSDFAVSSLEGISWEGTGDGCYILSTDWQPDLIDGKAFLTLTKSELDELKPSVSERQHTDLSYFEDRDIYGWGSWGKISGNGSPWQTRFIYPISVWQVHASPLAIVLPALWLACLVGVALWKKGTKLGSFGLILGGTGCAVMIASLFQAVLLNQIIAVWPFFTGGMILLGIGLVVFGLDALRSRILPRLNWLPALMGVAIIALEAANRLYLPERYEVWTQIQGLALAAISIAWLAMGWVVFSEKNAEPLPA